MIEGCVAQFKRREHVKNQSFKMPDNYYQFDGKEAETDNEQIEYDLDREVF